MKDSDWGEGAVRTIPGRAGLLSWLLLTGCYYHSVQPLLPPNSSFPLDSEVLHFEHRVLAMGAWTNPTPHRLRRVGPSTFRGEADGAPGPFAFNKGLVREIRFERLRPGFYAAMWKNDGDISQAPRGYFYEIVYVDSDQRHVYKWSMVHLVRIGERPNRHLYEFCAERYGGPPTTRPGITVTFGDRETFLRVMHGCIDEIVARRIPPSGRYRRM